MPHNNWLFGSVRKPSELSEEERKTLDATVLGLTLWEVLKVFLYNTPVLTVFTFPKLHAVIGPWFYLTWAAIFIIGFILTYFSYLTDSGVVITWRRYLFLVCWQCVIVSLVYMWIEAGSIAAALVLVAIPMLVFGFFVLWPEHE